jgi:hypothetical protein
MPPGRPGSISLPSVPAVIPQDADGTDSDTDQDEHEHDDHNEPPSSSTALRSVSDDSLSALSGLVATMGAPLASIETLQHGEHTIKVLVGKALKFARAVTGGTR